MPQPEIDRLSARRILSALADGDATDHEAQRAFQAWRDDGAVRADWHAYQLIGDVMRSDDLASSPAADQSFLVALRARLAAEPVVLAPVAQAVELPGAAVASGLANASAAANAGTTSWMRGRWQAPLAVAAGFIVMIGGINVVRPFGQASQPGRPGDQAVAALANVAASPAPGTANVVPASLSTQGASGPVTGPGAATGTSVATGPGVAATAAQTQAYNDQLAPYLAAHRQSTMNGVFQMPGGDLRNVSLVQTAP